jgi:uncharacterized phage protein (TIGR01671 family)
MTYKFRGYSLTQNKWIYGQLFTCGSSDNTYILPFGTDIVDVLDKYEGVTIIDEQYQVHPDSVGMATGLVDKNSVEIFDGDVVNSKREGEGLTRFKLVKYDNKSSQFICGGDNLSNQIWIHKQDNSAFEVAGSTFLNPELLK